MQLDSDNKRIPKLTAGERGLAYLDAHPNARLTVKSVAEAIGVNPTTLFVHDDFMAAFRERPTDGDRGLEYLAAHPNDHHTLASVARAVGVHRDTLQRHEHFMSALQERQESKDPARCPLAKFLQESYIPYKPELKPKSADQLRYSVTAFERFLERPALLADLDEGTLMRFISWRRQCAAPETTKRNRANLITLWRFASQRKLIPSRPVEGLPTVTVPKRNPIAWTLDEITKLLKACGTLEGRMFAAGDKKRRRWCQTKYTGPECSKFWAALILFIYDTGTRIGATLKIEPADIDLDRGVVMLRSDAAKTGREQFERLSPQTVAAIRDIYDPKARRVFFWGLSSPIQRTLSSILDKAGLPSGRERKFHCIRKTTATLAAAAGRRDLAQHTLGHTTPTMTADRYIDKRALPIESAADVLPRPAWGDSPPQMSPETPCVAVADVLKELSPDALSALLRLATTLAAAGKAPA